MGAAFCVGSRRALRAGFVFVWLFLCVIEVGRAQAQPGPDEVMRVKLRRCAKARGAEPCQAALPVCREMLDAARQGHPLAKQVHAGILGQLGACHEDLDQNAEAETYRREQVVVLLKEVGERHEKYAGALHDLALLLREQGKLDEAELLLRKVVKLTESIPGQDDEKKSAQQSLDSLIAERKDLAEALKEFGSAEGQTLFQASRQCKRAKTQEACTAALPACRSYVAAADEKLGTLYLKRAEVGRSLASCYVKLDRFSEAEAELRRLLDLLKPRVGERDQKYIASLANLGFVMLSMDRYAEAESISRAALALAKSVPGEQGSRDLHILNNLAEALVAQKKHAEAETVLRQALAASRGAGDDGSRYQDVVEKLVKELKAQGKELEIEELSQEAMVEKLKTELRAMSPIQMLAQLRKSPSSVRDPEGTETAPECVDTMPRYQREIAAAEARPEPQHQSMLASLLVQMGACQRELGQLRLAEAAYRRALGILERLGANQEPHYATALDGLGTVLSAKSSQEAIAPLQKALELRRAQGEARRHDVAHSLEHLAEAQENLGRYVEAESLHRQALALFTETVGPRHLDVAEAQTALAQLVLFEGQQREAEALLLQAAGFYERAGLLAHPGYARVLFHLGSWHQNEGNADVSEGRFRQSLALRRILFGERHPEYVKSLDAVASLLSRQGQGTVAVALFRRGLKVSQEVYGERSRYVAETLYHLSAAQLRLGNVQESRTLLMQAIGMAQEGLGKDHPDLVIYFRGLAYGFVKEGGTKQQGFLDAFSEALRINELQLRSKFTANRVTSLVEDTERLAVYLFAAAMDSPQPALLRLAMRTALLTNGRAAEPAILRKQAEKRGLLGPESVQRITAWRRARAEIARLVYRGIEKDPGTGLTQGRQVEAGFAGLRAARAAVERTEGELALSSAELSTLQPPAGDELLQAVAGKLPGDAVLIEMVALPEQQLGALLLFPDQRIEAVVLGSEEALGRDARAFLTAMRDPKKDPTLDSGALYRRLAPLFAKLGPARRLYLSLKEPLELLPFAALHDGERYLIDRSYTFISLGSGRELLRQPVAATARPGLVLADAKFGQATPPSAEEAEKRFFPLQNTIDLLGRMRALSALPGTRRETLHLLPANRGRVLTGAAASESALRQTPGPGLLHVATHGVFWDDPPRRARDAVDPLLCCGLALAGASGAARAADAEADGVLTADEARDLDLAETGLVVLAMQSAEREAMMTRQGALSMRRAFQSAGAETVVLNVWPLGDGQAGNLMQRYYQKLLAGRPRVTALYEAMREAKQAQAHPYFWAPFIATGHDAPLRIGPARPQR